VPESKLALANCQLELKDLKGAKATLTELVSSAPDSEAAQTAQQRLQILR
jgi:TolA-binding protein